MPLEIMDLSHSNAAGIKIKKSELNRVISQINASYPREEDDIYYPCDWEIEGPYLKEDYVREVAEHYDVFCSTVPEPLFAITNIRINASQINVYGENKGFIKFNYNGVQFAKDFCKHDDYDNMTLNDGEFFGVNNKELELTIIGRFVLDKYNEVVLPQVKITDFGVKEVKDGTRTTASPVRKPIKKAETIDDFDW